LLKSAGLQKRPRGEERKKEALRLTQEIKNKSKLLKVSRVTGLGGKIWPKTQILEQERRGRLLRLHLGSEKWERGGTGSSDLHLIRRILGGIVEGGRGLPQSSTYHTKSQKSFFDPFGRKGEKKNKNFNRNENYH